MTALLEVNGLVKSFGGVRAVDDVSIDVEAGTITGLIGPNGSGKTTLLGMISGTHNPTAGSVRLGGQDITGLPAHRMVRAGVARTFQTTRVLNSWTVYDSLNLVAMSGNSSTR